MSKGYICDICEKFVDNPFKVHMREFVMTIDWGDGTASPSKIRNKVHMCGDCYTKFVNYIKYKSLKEKVDEQTERSMPKGDNPVGYHDEHSRILRYSTCNGCDDKYIRTGRIEENDDISEEDSVFKCYKCAGCQNDCDRCPVKEEEICDGCTADCPKKG